MKIQRAYKVELDPNNKQKTLLNKTAGVARFAYNWGLVQRIELYEKENKSLSCYDQQKLLNAVKKDQFPWMYEVSKCAPQCALKNLDIAFKNFYRGLTNGLKTGFPNFKAKNKCKESFSISDKFYVTNSSVHVPRIGEIRLKQKNYIPLVGIHINSITFSKHADKWFASVQCSQDIPNVLPTTTVLGVDVGIKTLAVCSNGQTFENNKYLKKSKKKLVRAQRSLARKQFNKETKKSSNNRNKAKLIVQKIHYKISNQRKDSIHKMTSALAKTKPRYIVLEDLNVSGMMKNHKLAGAVSDASFFEIKRQLMYKTSWYGGEVIAVNRFFPSSKMCSNCGVIKDDLTLNDRVYVCECGLTIDRDLNAAINLEKYGLSTLSSRGIKACGESVRLQDACGQEAVSMKQEENTDVTC